jgi:hypothetical protein
MWLTQQMAASSTVLDILQWRRNAQVHIWAVGLAIEAAGVW